MLVIYIVTALFIAWIWVDYFRLIDLYEKDSLLYFVLAFGLGCATVPLAMFLYQNVVDVVSDGMNGDFVNDFLYSVFAIGLTEEFVKILPFAIIYPLFRSKFKEPIDILAFICVSALGFSAVENIYYFLDHGPTIITSRAILCSVGHMFDTALIAYGIILYKYKHKKWAFLWIPLFFFFAIVSHGFYDFWLMYEGARSGGWLITLAYFMLSISIFAVIINNAINNSSFFTYKKIVDSNKVSKRLLTYYGIVFGIQFVLITYVDDFFSAFINLVGSIIIVGFIVMVACVRLSRFKLIQNRWNRIKFEMPFSYGEVDPYGSGSLYRLRVKGDSFNEAYINIFYDEHFWLNPVNRRSTFIGGKRLGYIGQKVFLKNDESFYVAKLYKDDVMTSEYEMVLLKPKTNNITMVNDEFPIVALLKLENITDIENTKLGPKDFKFREWVFIKPWVEELSEDKEETQVPKLDEHPLKRIE